MNLFDAPAVATTSTMSDYNDAVNASRFVKGFGIAVLVYSILLLFGINLLSAAIGLGTGLFIFRYDAGRFYRVLGIVVMVLALVAPFPFLSPAVLSSAVLYKGSTVLGVLGRSSSDDADWSDTRRRTILGLVAASAALLVTILVAVLVIAAVAMLIVRRAH